MPKGKRGRRKRKASLRVGYNAVITVKGPYQNRGWLKERLRSRIFRSLRRCPMLLRSGFADRIADKIADESIEKFVYSNKYTRGVIRIHHMDVVYQNPPVHWKWWSRWRNNRDTLVITGDRYHESNPRWS